MVSARNMMEVGTGKSHSGEKRAFKGSTSDNEVKRSAENNGSASVFTNQAAIAWQENRRMWTGDQSQRGRKLAKDPIISWSTTYEDLLSNNDSFPERIPLAEMVDFLVDIWHDEGLYD